MCPSDLRSNHSTETGSNGNNNNVSNDNNNDDICNTKNNSNNSNSSNEHDDNDDQDDINTNKSEMEISKRLTSSKSANEQDQDATSSTTASTSSSTSINFPRLLHEIISDPQTDHLIHWLPGGTHFYISDKKRFASEILSSARFGHAKFASFIRRLKRWGFVRVPSGPLMGAYFHLGFRKGEAVALELGKCPKAGGVVAGENALAALAAGGGRYPSRHDDVMAMAMMNNALRNGGSDAKEVAFGNGHPHANLNASFNSTAMTMPLANPQGREMGMMMPPPFDCADAASFASLSPNSFQNRNLNFSHSINSAHNHMINNGLNNNINSGVNNGMFNNGMFNNGINNNHMINYGNRSNRNQLIINNNLMMNGNYNNYNDNNTFHSDPPPGSMEHSLRQRLLQMSNNRNNNLDNATTATTSTTMEVSNNNENYRPMSRGPAMMSSSSMSMSSAGNSNHGPFSQSL